MSHAKEHAYPIGVRIMVWTLSVGSVLLGIAYSGDPSRYTAPGFRAAADVADFHVYGIIYVVLGLALAVSWLAQRLTLTVLYLLGVYYAFWAGLFAWSFLASLLPDPGLFAGAAPTGTPTYGMVSMLCFAIALTVTDVRDGGD